MRMRRVTSPSILIHLQRGDEGHLRVVVAVSIRSSNLDRIYHVGRRVHLCQIVLSGSAAFRMPNMKYDDCIRIDTVVDGVREAPDRKAPNAILLAMQATGTWIMADQLRCLFDALRDSVGTCEALAPDRPRNRPQVTECPVCVADPHLRC